MADKNHILTLSCEDRPRIVATVTGRLADLGGNIAESSQFWDRGTNRLILRIHFTAPGEVTPDTIRQAR